MVTIKDETYIGIRGSVDKKLGLKLQRSQNVESNGEEELRERKV